MEKLPAKEQEKPKETYTDTYNGFGNRDDRLSSRFIRGYSIKEGCETGNGL